MYVCSSLVDCAVLISAQDDVLQSIDTAIQRIYDEAAANSGMMNEQQRQTLAYVVYCVCFIVQIRCTTVCVEYAAVYVITFYYNSTCMIMYCVQQCTYIRTYISPYVFMVYNNVHKYWFCPGMVMD